MSGSSPAVLFQNAARISNPAGARWSRIRLGILRKAASCLPLAPGVVPFGGVYYIPGHDDALAALASDSMFATLYKQTMAALDSNNEISLLAYDQTQQTDYDDYQKNLCEVMRSMPLRMAADIGRDAAAAANSLLDANGLRFDFMADLVIPITLQVMLKHFGVKLKGDNAEREFLKWMMAILLYVFGPPGSSDDKKNAALAAGQLMDQALKDQIANAEAGDGDILSRMKQLNMDDRRIQPTLAALLVGAIPTVTQGAYNILKVLLARPAAMQMTREAAQQDDEALGRCLYEALRFRPVLPVIFRKCVIPPPMLRQPDRPQDHVLGPVDWLGRHIPYGATIGIIGVTANFDPRAIASPREFNPSRPPSDSLVFGHGRHWCLGIPITMAVLVNIFRPLLNAGAIRPRALSTARYFMDYFAERFEIVIDPDGA